jgi:predicted phosphate transport protein (TIGR00153 family)
LARFPSFSLGGRERSILQGMEQHLSMVKRCVVAYQTFVTSFAEREPPSDEALAEIFALQDGAKAMRRDLSSKIAEGAFFGGVREDILTLIQTNDNIADSAKDAARLLAIGMNREPAFLETLRSVHMVTFQKNLLAAVLALESLIQALQNDRKGVVSKIHAVGDCEEAADTEKDHLLRGVFGERGKMDPVSIIELRDFIFASDDIADNAEHASDVVLVLVAKGYG